jgi:mercuric ion transport protein
MSGYVRWARFAFNLVAWLFAACVAVQIYLAGLAVFAVPAVNDFDTHRNFSYLFGVLTLVLIVLAIVARLPRRVIAASAQLIVLFTLQSVFVAMRVSTPAFAALHPLNGFLIFLVSLWVAWTTRGYLRLSPAITPTPAEPATDNRAG